MFFFSYVYSCFVSSRFVPLRFCFALACLASLRVGSLRSALLRACPPRFPPLVSTETLPPPPPSRLPPVVLVLIFKPSESTYHDDDDNVCTSALPLLLCHHAPLHTLEVSHTYICTVFSPRYDRKEISKRGVPGVFAQCCVRGPLGPSP